MHRDVQSRGAAKRVNVSHDIHGVNPHMGIRRRLE